MTTTPTFSTFLWYERNAEEAVTFYTTVFPNARITKVTRWGDGGPVPKGTVMTAAFELAGQMFVAMNGGPHHTLTPAASIVVSCETQEEIDRYWDVLTGDGGRPGQCGWLEDRFGLSWQVVPSTLGDLLADTDPVKAARVGRALMTMTKLDIDALRQAHRGA